MAEPVLTSWQCIGCGEETRQPWACPNRGRDDVEHLLVRRLIIGRVDFRDPEPLHANPFVRYRRLSQTYHLARIAGMSDDVYVAMVERLDARVQAVDSRGRGFEATPTTRLPKADGSLGMWLKHDWRSVSGSHKARHLMGIALHLKVGEALGARKPGQRLAIASCGNAALAAAVVAGAMECAIDVFIPADAKPRVVEQLKALGATLTICERSAESPPGDPCYHAFRKAVANGALPFCVQGPDCGLTIEGGRTLGWEIASAIESVPAQERPNRVVIQVGGGAMGSAVFAGLSDFVALDRLDEVPALYTVQTQGCAPLHRAWERIAQAVAAQPHTAEKTGGDLLEAIRTAAKTRSQYMWPWESTPHSLAHGILDDETYDWHPLVTAMASSGGAPLLVNEDQLREAKSVASAAAGGHVSYTGAAGLAGALQFDPTTHARTLVILSGRDRDA